MQIPALIKGVFEVYLGYFGGVFSRRTKHIARNTSFSCFLEGFGSKDDPLGFEVSGCFGVWILLFWRFLTRYAFLSFFDEYHVF